MKIDRLLREVHGRLYRETHTSEVSAGGLTDQWARRLDLEPGTAVAVGAFGAHMGAGAAKSGALGKFRGEIERNILFRLAAEAEKVEPLDSTVLALDWLNGRRTPFADNSLKGAIIGLTLGTNAPKIFRALVEATAFGSRAIVEQFRRQGLPINTVIALGGIARKSPLVMQVMADVLDMTIRVAASEQACALGAAMFGAVAAGAYPSVIEAQKRMSSGFDMVFAPSRRRAGVYARLYRRYASLAATLEGFLRTA
jgi:L-ribulokinase